MLKQKSRNFIERARIAGFRLYPYLGIKRTQAINTFIVGTQKGGTSALFSYLEQSPLVVRGRKKEVGYFSRDYIHNRGAYWYEEQFQGEPGNILIDATPEYLYYPDVPQRIHAYNPKAKVIMLLREPVSRAFSHYTMFRNIHEQKGQVKKDLLMKFKRHSRARPLHDLISAREFPSFSQVINEELSGEFPGLEPSFLRRGMYYEQVKRYLEVFSRDQVLILESNAMKENKIAMLEKTCGFLNLPSGFLNQHNFKNKHIGNYKSGIKKEDEDFLKEVYQEPNEKLFRLISKRFDW